MPKQPGDRRVSSKANARSSAPDRRGSPYPVYPGEKRLAVTLTRKFAQMIDGVDLRGAEVGDRLQLTPQDAEVLIKEGWAEPARRAGDVQSIANDRSQPLKRRSRR